MTGQADPALIGSRIGVYRIDSILGAGGMGDVYRAHDTRLRRDVAVKILKATVSKDPERLARFEREARALAALNHPNIAGIYGLEEGASGPALILELVEGDTLAGWLHKGPLSVPEGVRVARQIASALDAAHEKGIIHRDLKPANIKITPLGTVKVLDFGLAKLEGDGNADLTNAPTATVAHTREGAIVGTVGYMSPEQARGRPLDKRTDIWSFGCVLYEMLTGRRPFEGETIADTLAAILEHEPDWSLLPGTMPETIRLLLQRCLEKDPRDRLRDIGDVWFELDRSSVQPGPPAARSSDSKTGGPRAHRSYGPLALGAGVVVLVDAVDAALALRGGWLRPDVSEPPVQLTDFNDSVIAPSLSHDGRMLTFIRGADFGRTAPSGRVYVKLLPSGVPVELTHGPTGAGYPTFSPDDARIVYTVVMPGLKWDSWQVPVLGGPPQPFLPNASGLVWLDERRLMYSSIRSGLHMGIVSSTEARSEETTIYFPSSNDGMAHRSAPSPDGKSLLVVEMDRGTWQPCRLVPIDGSSAGRSVSPPGAQCTSAAWSPDGRWMYFSSNAGGEYHIWRQRYPDGAPEQITFGPTEQEGTAITPDGKSLITSMGLQRAGIWLVDADGERALTDEGYAMFPTMTPSGARLFYLRRK